MTKRYALIGSLWTFVGNSGQQLLGFVVFVYLARVLKPGDFGVMALAAAVIDLLTVAGRFGQVEALLQKRTLDDTTCSTSFWILFALGMFIMALVGLLASPTAALFDSSILIPILFILAPVPLIQNLGQVHEAFLRRNFNYKGIAARNVGATLLGGLAAVIGVSLDYGVYALVLQKLVYTLTYTILVWIAFPWFPRFRFERSTSTSLLKSGRDVSVGATTSILNLRIIDFFVGYFLGVVVLGYLRIAWRVFDLMAQLIIRPLSNVSISSLTRHAGDTAALKRTYLIYLQALSFVAAPTFAYIGIMSSNLISIAAGPRWEYSAVLLSILTATALAAPITSLFAPAMVAAGHTGPITRQSLLQTGFTTITIPLAAPLGIIAVMITHIARVYLFAGIQGWRIQQTLGVSVGEFAYRMAPPAFSAGVALAAAFIIQAELTANLDAIWEIMIVGVVGSSVYLCVLVIGDICGLWRGYTSEAYAAFQNVVLRRSSRTPIVPADEPDMKQP